MRKRLGKDFPKIMDLIREQLPDDGLFVRDQTISALTGAINNFRFSAQERQ